MGYFTLDLIKARLEMLPTDTSIDSVLNNFGDEGDVFVDSFMGNMTPVTTVPGAYRHASSNYAAGSYKKERLKDDLAGKALQDKAREQLMDYKKGPGRITVFG